MLSVLQFVYQLATSKTQVFDSIPPTATNVSPGTYLRLSSSLQALKQQNALLQNDLDAAVKAKDDNSHKLQVRVATLRGARTDFQDT